MTEIRSIEACPAWCDSEQAGVGVHLHLSSEVLIETATGQLVTRLLREAGDPEHRILVGGKAATVQEARAFASALRRFVDHATEAPAGLGFIGDLAASAGIADEEMAWAAELELESVQEQKAGGQVLSVREFDRLALAVARLAAKRLADWVSAEGSGRHTSAPPSCAAHP